MKRILTVLTLVVVMLTLPMSAAYAEKPIPVSGETNQIIFDILNPEAVVMEADGNVFLEVDIIDVWTGDIAGESNPFTASFVVRNWGDPGDCPPFGFCEGTDTTEETKITVHQIFTFEDPIILGDQYEGTMTMKANILAKGSELEGRWEIIDGTGALTHLHGQGTLRIVPNPAFDPNNPPPNGPPPVLHQYEGQIHFHPKDK